MIQSRNNILVLLFLIILCRVSFAHATSGSSVFPDVKYSETRAVLQCLYPRLNALGYPDAMIHQSRVFEVQRAYLFKNRWHLFPPTYRPRFEQTHKRDHPHPFYIPDSPLTGLTTLWYFYVYDLTFHYLRTTTDWDDEFIKVVGALISASVLRPCLLKDRFWPFLFDKIVSYDFDEAVRLRYRGLFTYAIRYLYQHDIRKLLNAAHQWYRDPEFLQSLNALKKSGYRELRQHYLRDVFGNDAVIKRPMRPVTALKSDITLHLFKMVLSDPDHALHDGGASPSKRDRPISVVIGLPLSPPFVFAVPVDEEMSFETLKPYIDDLLSHPPDYWGDYLFTEAIPSPLYDEMVSTLARRSVTPLQCDSTNGSAKRWVSFKLHDTRVTLVHVSAPLVTGGAFSYAHFFEAGRATRGRGGDRVSCIQQAVQKTRPRLLVITGNLYIHEIAQLMRRLPADIKVICYGTLPDILIPDPSDVQTAHTYAYQLKNWMFLSASHVGVKMAHRTIAFTYLPLP